MTRRAPVKDINEDDLVIGTPKKAAAGLEAVVVALDRGIAQAGVGRTARALLRLNQRGGTDCPGCAWPESTGHRKTAEFCENGAKAVAEENTLRTVGPEFWARAGADAQSAVAAKSAARTIFMIFPRVSGAR